MWFVFDILQRVSAKDWASVQDLSVANCCFFIFVVLNGPIVCNSSHFDEGRYQRGLTEKWACIWGMCVVIVDFHFYSLLFCEFGHILGATSLHPFPF